MTPAAAIPEGVQVALVVMVPSIVAFLLGRYSSPWCLGLVVAVAWIPSLLLFCDPPARASIVGATVLTFFPILAAFTLGMIRRRP